MLLEVLFRDTLAHFNIQVLQSFTRNKGGEQIDGAFSINGYYYIVECRWRDQVTNERQVDGLLGQVRRSGNHTRGVFFSVNGWSKHVPDLLKQNSDKVIILMDGQDFRAVLAGEITMPELLEAKQQELSLRSEPFISAAGLIAQNQI